MYYIVYETTNRVNGKRYRGVYKTENLQDGYLGSGKAFLLAVKKYGKEQFDREILHLCESFEHALDIEREIVDAAWVADRMTYNVKIGGLGSVGMTPWNKGAKGAQEAWNKGIEMGPMSDEDKAKRVIAMQAHYAANAHGRKGNTYGPNKNKRTAPTWNKGISMPKQECPHCDKQADASNLKRWHLDNCRFKP